MSDDELMLAGRQILIADDDDALREIIRISFERRGANVKEASHGGIALDAISSDAPFDLVITDVLMPTMTGVELLARARANGSLTPFIVITAFSDESVRNEVMRFESAILLDKPFEFTDLIKMAKKMLVTPI